MTAAPVVSSRCRISPTCRRGMTNVCPEWNCRMSMNAMVNSSAYTTLADRVPFAISQKVQLPFKGVSLVRLGAMPGWVCGCHAIKCRRGDPASVFSPGSSVSAASSARTSPRPVGSARSSPEGDGAGHPCTAASDRPGLGSNAMKLPKGLALNGLDRTHAPAYSAPHANCHAHRVCAAPAGWNDPIPVARKFKQAALHPPQAVSWLRSALNPAGSIIVPWSTVNIEGDVT